MGQAGLSSALSEATLTKDSLSTAPALPIEAHPAVDLNAAVQGGILALVRIAMGFFWLQESLFKVPGQTKFFKNLLLMVANNTFVPGYAGIVKTLFVPNATLFALFVYLLETAIALSLLFGVFTRMGGVVGAIWGALLFCGLAYGKGPGGPSPWFFGMIVLLCALLALTAAGRSLGVDRWLRPLMLRRAEQGDRRARYVALAE